MNEMGLDRVYSVINDLLAQRDYQRMAQMLWPALNQFPSDQTLWHYATHLCTAEDKHAMAMLCAQKAIDLAPTTHDYTNLGSILRRLNMPKEAEAALREAVGYDPDNKHPWNNLAATFVNEGNPWPGIEAGEKALELDPNFDKARWNLGLLQLEAGLFERGWDNYRQGLVIGERLLKEYGGEKEPELLETRDDLLFYRETYKRKPRVIVWGEQGLGDEIMFSTVLPDLAEDADIIFDCHPRMHQIMQDSYGDVTVGIYPTRKERDVSWYADIEPADFKCSVGDLPRWYRRSRQAFEDAWEQSPWLVPSHRWAEYRQGLEELCPQKKKVGFAWTGGIITTQRWYRSIDLPLLKDILLHEDIMPVSLQYEDDTVHVQKFYEATNKMIYRFPGVTSHFDYQHTLDLVCGLDAVVTVCQSVAHLCAAAGVQTYVLAPKNPAWRYGLDGRDWFWYGPDMLYRENKNGWGDALTALTDDLLEYLEC